MAVKTAGQLRKVAGSLLEKVALEALLASRRMEHLTKSLGTRTAAATSGVDLAAGSTVTHFGVFFAPKALTLVALYYYLNEAYVKNTTDAKIEILEGSTVLFTRTLTAGGEAADSMTTVTPSVTTLAAGDRVDIKITQTGGSGTGYADIILEYYETP